MCVRVGVVRVRVAGREIPLIAEIETIGSRTKDRAKQRPLCTAVG